MCVSIAKAFDSVLHEILLRKLNLIGIRDHANDLLKSYLLDRKQFVKYKNEYSDKETVKSGATQGSTLEPL
jgi:Reverse transcriptase (RNA-dependent DNA polymerase)